MFFRPAFSFFAFIFLVFSISNVSAAETGYFYLASEPSVRIGLATNARSVSITTTDTSLVATSPDEPNKLLATNKVFVAPRAYRPPEIEFYRFEIPNIETQAEADSLAADIREATGEKAFAMLGQQPATWRVVVGDTKDTIEEANEFKAELAEKGFEDVVIVTEKKTQPSEDAVALSEQLKSNPNSKSEVRSLIKPTGSTQSTTDNVPIDPNVKEILVSGAAESAKFSSFKPLAFGSLNERAMPVRLNGKAYRGKIEVFVNSRGTLTVVNVVPLEDYLLGVVPNELGLPSLEAQKAQAVAARTYAVANIGGFASQGFDLLPTVWSQVYRGVSSEGAMPTQAVMQTRGIVATYKGKPINALYTSTCGGRTENSENIFDYNEPYLRGVECSFEGRKYFEPFLIKSTRELPKIDNENQLEMVRLAAQFSVNGFVMAANRFTDEWFELPPTDTEIKSWTNQLALKFGKPYPVYSPELVRAQDFAAFLAGLIYTEGQADTLLSESDITYQLSFPDAFDIDKDKRANVAMLFRDGWLSLYPDANFHPHRPLTRGRMLRLIQNIYAKKKWLPALQTGVARPTADGKLILKVGKSERPLMVSPSVFLFRQFGDQFYQVKETALIGGEEVAFMTGPTGEVVYLEVKPSDEPTVAEKMSPFTFWNANLTPGAVQARLSRYVRGIGGLIDVRIAKKGFSRRATDLEIVGTNGVFHLTGGKIRSALRLREQLFVLNKRYDGAGRVTAYSFTGRGWGHGVGMCQYGAFGMGKMGYKYDQILKHYYTGIELTKAY
ncbi:MAG: SpoIID/LytB domain-containing protein [Acidobacteria bacterium]|nr:SpoIID/LytB domain-containing protein [Acidobacteriota bacterium]